MKRLSRQTEMAWFSRLEEYSLYAPAGDLRLPNAEGHGMAGRLYKILIAVIASSHISITKRNKPKAGENMPRSGAKSLLPKSSLVGLAYWALVVTMRVYKYTIFLRRKTGAQS